MNQNAIYLDYAASTPFDEQVLSAMRPYQQKFYGNSSALHRFALNMRKVQDQARGDLAAELHSDTTGIIFTASATEANNLALKGFARANREKGNHLIISAIEHSSVFETAQFLQTQGFEICFLKVDHNGLVNMEMLRDSIRDDTLLVSILHVNNEIGTIQPLAEIGKICRNQGVAFHTDAAQGFGRFALDVKEMKIDMLSASAHKIYGPLGAAFLYVGPGIKISPLLHGGGQEQGLRAATVNVPAVLGFAEAAKILAPIREQEAARLSKLKMDFLEKIKNKISRVVVNGDTTSGSPYILNVSFLGCDAEILAMQLDQQGVAVSTGSACASGSVKESRVLQALHKERGIVKSAIRFSFGKYTTANDLETVSEKLAELVRKVRKIS